jgi:two-component system phosphate regulon sensor histidine kinase PhoR
MCDLPKKPAEVQEFEERLTSLEKELSVADFIFRGIKDGLIFIDASGRVGRINPVMEEILGVKDKDIRGKYLHELLGGSNLCPMITGSAGGHVNLFAVKDREFEVETSQLTGGDGEHIGSVTLFHDITEKRRLEHQRADFVSMVTHDLKSPLTTILGYTALLLEGGMGEMTPDIKESVKAINRSGEKLLTLIDDFLALSRLDSGMEPPTYMPVYLDKIAEDVVSSFWPEASRRGKLLELCVDPDLPAVMGDARQIERLLANLIDNAIKFTGERGCVRVSLALRDEHQVAERAGGKPGTPGPHVELAVKDNGIGISPEDVPHLFERYWRGRQSRGIRGSGLGLAIVKCSVDAHGGTLKVESAPGEGSVFYVWLPVKR